MYIVTILETNKQTNKKKKHDSKEIIFIIQ